MSLTLHAGAERPMDGYMPAQPAAPAPTPAPPAPTVATADATSWSNAPTTTVSSAGLNGNAASLPGGLPTVGHVQVAARAKS